MLNRGSSAVHAEDPRPWAIRPRRAQTTNYTIHDGNFITDNRQETTIHHDNSHTINTSHNNTVFHGPVQGYVHSAKNGGEVNAFVQITNVTAAGGLRGANQIDGLNDNPSPSSVGFSHPNRADRTISQIDTAQMSGGMGPNKGMTLAGSVGDGSSSASTADRKLEQEIHNISPEMKDFVKALERQNKKVNAGSVKGYQRRNHTI